MIEETITKQEKYEIQGLEGLEKLQNHCIQSATISKIRTHLERNNYNYPYLMTVFELNDGRKEVWLNGPHVKLGRPIDQLYAKLIIKEGEYGRQEVFESDFDFGLRRLD